jgi:hypothetical protein
MDARDRTLLWAIAFYVCIDALPRVASFCERVAGWLR